MKSGLALASLLFAVLLVQGYARTERVAMVTHVGKVEALYEETHAGVYVPRRASEQRDAPLWVHVRFPRPLEDGRSFTVAAVPEGTSVKIDDNVEVKFGDSTQVDTHGPERNVVVGVVEEAVRPAATATLAAQVPGIADARPAPSSHDLRATIVATPLFQ